MRPALREASIAHVLAGDPAAMSRNPASIAEWFTVCERHERLAFMAAEDKKAAALALFHVGSAVECALKAYIWHRERFNQWPDKASRPDLYRHDLRELLKISGIEPQPTDPTAPGWLTVLQWDRNQAYDPKRMPRTVARSYVEAAFGKDGVVTWLRLTLKNAI